MRYMEKDKDIGGQEERLRKLRRAEQNAEKKTGWRRVTKNIRRQTEISQQKEKYNLNRRFVVLYCYVMLCYVVFLKKLIYSKQDNIDEKLKRTK